MPAVFSPDTPTQMEAFYASIDPNRYEDRMRYINDMGFVVMRSQHINELAQVPGILNTTYSVGAGSCALEWELNHRGFDIIPTDINHWNGTHHFLETGAAWLEPLQMDGVDVAAQCLPDENLLFSWPEYGEPWTDEVLLRFNGNLLIYIGEWRGCTGGPNFHDILLRRYDIIAELGITTFPYIHDRVFVAQRKK